MLLTSHLIDASGATQDQIRVIGLRKSHSSGILVIKRVYSMLIFILTISCTVILAQLKELSQLNQLFACLTIRKLSGVQGFGLV